MKKFFIILSCVFFINAILDTENIDLEIERIGENSVKISWSINYEDYDEIVLKISCNKEEYNKIKNKLNLS